MLRMHYLTLIHSVYVIIIKQTHWFVLANNDHDYIYKLAIYQTEHVLQVQNKEHGYKCQNCMNDKIPNRCTIDDHYSDWLKTWLICPCTFAWHGPLTRYVKIAGCACTRKYAGNIFPTTDFKVNRLLAILTCITARAPRTCRDACRDR